MSACWSKNTHPSDRYHHPMSHVLLSLQVLLPHMYMVPKVGIAESTDVLVCNGAIKSVEICCRRFFTFLASIIANISLLIRYHYSHWPLRSEGTLRVITFYLLFCIYSTGWVSHEHQSIANLWQLVLFFNSLFGLKAKKTLEVLHYCPSQRTSYVEIVSLSWHHHAPGISRPCSQWPVTHFTNMV